MVNNTDKKPTLLFVYSAFSIIAPPALAAAVLYFTTLLPAWRGDLEIWRVYALAAPTVLTVGVCVVFGILLGAMRKVWAALGCAVGSILLALAYCVPTAALTGFPPIKLASLNFWAFLGFLAIPLLMLLTLPLILAEIRTAPPPAAKPASPIYKVSTLRYTVFGLFVVFFWLLWGDFTMGLMETVIPTIVPLQLNNLGASPVTLSIIMGTISYALNFLVNPVVSFRSDRHRGRWGRRKPFLLFPTPFIALVLIALAFVPEIGTWLHGIVSAKFGAVGETSLIIGVIGVLMVAFQFFNMFIGSVYWYLLNDVVPEHFLSRFMALFRIVGLAAATVYNVFVFKYNLIYTRYIFLGAAALYFVGFMSMCWKVREGRFPPPPPLLGKRKGIIASIKTYCKESYSHPFYLCIFGFSACLQVSGACGFAATIFYLSLSGVTMEKLGFYNTAVAVASALLTVPIGWLADRFHPVRLVFWAMLWFPILSIASFFFLRDFWTLIALTVIGFAPGLFYGVAVAPMIMMLFPKERYGQFGSADAVVRSLSSIIMSLVAGGFLYLIQQSYQKMFGLSGNEFYRWMYVWAAVFQVGAWIFIWRVYMGWKKYGGMKNYVPPSVGPLQGEEEPEQPTAA